MELDTPEKKKAYLQWWQSYLRNCPDKIRSKIPFYPKAPCQPRECDKHMTHLHFSCLTCPPRRFNRDPEHGKFAAYKNVLLLLQSPSGRKIILPKRYMSYGIFIPLDKYGHAEVWKRILLKFLLSVAERIAEV